MTDGKIDPETRRRIDRVQDQIDGLYHYKGHPKYDKDAAEVIAELVALKSRLVRQIPAAVFRG